MKDVLNVSDVKHIHTEKDTAFKGVLWPSYLYVQKGKSKKRQKKENLRFQPAL